MRMISMILTGLVLTIGFCGCDDSKDQEVLRKYKQQQAAAVPVAPKPVDPNSPEGILLASKKALDDAKAKTPDDAPELDAQIQSMIRRRNEVNLLTVSSALTMYAGSHNATLPGTLDDLVTAKLITQAELFALKRRPVPKLDLTKPISTAPAPELNPLVAGAPLVYVAAGRKLVSISKEQNSEFVLVYNPEPLSDERVLAVMLDGKVKSVTTKELARRLTQQKAGQ